MHSDFPPIRKHLFLTGDKQVGKSTLLRNLIEMKKLECTGFETRAFHSEGKRRGFTLHGRVEMPEYENDCICCARIEEKRSVPVLPVFEENGSKILRLSRNTHAPYILMDELGRLERNAESFIREIYACLNSDKRVIGVLQKCNSTHVDAISSRDDVTIISVSPENRDALLPLLLDAFE